MRQALHSFDHIFTQNESSKVLLNSIGLLKVSVSGDTRFDRVQKQLQIDNIIAFIEIFRQNHPLVVFGSSWPADDALFVPFINAHKHSGLKFLIAPHKISKKYTEQLASQLSAKKVVAYSDTDINDTTRLKEAEVFILDTIGYLSKAYSYADIAYVGGAAGKTGLHNILEPAVFGLPIITGTHYDKFPEAVDLVGLGGVYPVKTSEEFERVLNHWLKNEAERQKTGAINYNYVKNRSGAVKTIMQVLEEAAN
jgi:3-deoxy-D-manno-octulosonic-acid transferase